MMSEYQKQELLKQLAREGLGIRAQRIAVRRTRLEQSKMRLESLLKEYDEANEVINGSSKAY